jgi:uncharacterized phage-associated protein
MTPTTEARLVSPSVLAEHLLWLRRYMVTTPLHIVKLVYLCHGWMLGIRRRPLINETPTVGQFGPVVRSIYDEYKVYGSDPIPVSKAVEHSTDLTEDQNAVVNFVHGLYGDFMDTELSAMTHEAGTPWSEANDAKGIGAPIPDDAVMAHYAKLFENIKNQP